LWRLLALRFRKSFKLAPGIRLDRGKRSVGVSADGRGARFSLNSRGQQTASAGVPGTGVGYQRRWWSRRRRPDAD
jgi:hypothetical protein